MPKKEARPCVRCDHYIEEHEAMSTELGTGTACNECFCPEFKTFEDFVRLEEQVRLLVGYAVHRIGCGPVRSEHAERNKNLDRCDCGLQVILDAVKQ